MRCSSRSTVIFLIVSKEIQKYDQRKFYFFSEKKHFQIWYSRSSLKKKSQKKCTIFSVHQNCKTKKFAISKISNKKLRKIHYFANIKYKRIRENIVKKSLQKYFCDKKNFRQKKFDKKNFHQKKKCIEKNYRKKNSKKILKIILAIFLYLKKSSVNFRKKKSKKILKIIFAIFLFLKKKSVNSPINE